MPLHFLIDFLSAIHANVDCVVYLRFRTRCVVDRSESGVPVFWRTANRTREFMLVLYLKLVTRGMVG